MDVFVTGGSGYVGGYVLRALSRAGHGVSALARSPSAAARVASLGAEPIDGSVTERGAWMAVAQAADAIIHLAIPPPERDRHFYEWTPFSSRWVETVRAFEARALPLLFESAHQGGKCRAIVTTTGPGAAGHHGDAFIDEEARGPTSSFGSVQREVEQRTLDAARAGLPAMVLRPGAVYGPDGGFGARVLGSARRGHVFFVGEGTNFVSWVHIEDYAEAYLPAIEGAASGHVVAIIDDEPLRSRDAMRLLATLADAGSPRRIPTALCRVLRGPVITGWATQSARMSNRRAKDLLGWRPRRATVRDGFPEVLARVAEPGAWDSAMSVP